MTLNMILTVFTKNTLIFSNKVYLIDLKMLDINVMYRVAMRRRYKSIDIQLIFQKYLFICNDSI